MKTTTWNLDPPPGFQGLHPDKPVTVYYRHLPHWRQDGASYFVTFRLNDSLPQAKLQELALLKEDWDARHPPPKSAKSWEDLARMTMERVENWLDQGIGECWLRQPDLAKIVVDALHYFDGARYELGCFVVMPNHVHAVIRPLEPATMPLEKILQSRKRVTSRDIHRVLGREGTFWQDESFDRIIRDEEHLYRCIQYIGNNPKRAGLTLVECPRWIRPEWVKLGWQFEDSTM